MSNNSKRFSQRRRKNLGLTLGILLLSVSWLVSADAAEDTARERIEALQETWNRGDMGAYLANYHRDAPMVLSFGNTLVQGWNALDELFRQSYPDPLRMGRFTIDELHVQVLEPTVAIAFGNFTHVFPTETIKGGFSHVLTREGEGPWLIRHERTSRGEVLHTE